MLVLWGFSVETIQYSFSSLFQSRLLDKIELVMLLCSQDVTSLLVDVKMSSSHIHAILYCQ